ncbi:MAG: hypothetical protein KDE28_05235, partial [Anaerolineales bacterium]|nr:hypothetical protein [Anaerolineales bacterium]
MTERLAYHTDESTIKDHLHFSDFRPALNGILRQAETPLTVGVFGAWGSGKTSLLRMLYDDIEEAGNPNVRTVWFTAWKYDRQEVLWRAFMLRVLNALYPRKSEPTHLPREERDLIPKSKLNKSEQQLVTLLNRLEESVYQTVEWEDVGERELDLKKLGGRSLSAGVKLSAWLASMGLYSHLAELVDKDASALDDIQVAAEAISKQRRQMKRQQLVHMEQFEQSFAEAVRLVGQSSVAIKPSAPERGRLIVFVDDLDRCLPEKAIEVLEAIKLFLSVKGVVFILGMDQEVVQRGIEARYGALFKHEGNPQGELPIRGDTYLQKLVQIPFHLPPLSRINVEKFIGDLENDGGKRLSALTRQVFAAGLFPNPRQVKRALNIFQLLKQIAAVRMQDLDEAGQPRLDVSAFSDPLLAKTVVIQTQYPELYQDWRRYPILIRELEARVQGRRDLEQELVQGLRGRREEMEPDEREEAPTVASQDGRSELLDKYLRARQKYALLEQMLRFPTAEDEAKGKERGRFAKLNNEQMAIYVRLAGSVAAEEIEEIGPVDLPTELLSNDWVRIKSALEGLDEKLKADPTPLRDSLKRSLGGTELRPLERVSAGVALGLIGDDRPGVTSLEPEMVPIVSGLRFLMGDDENEITIPQPYAIGRYLITNAQYRYFIEDGGYRDERLLKECW